MTNNNSPWSALDAATAENKLFLEPDLSDAVDRAFDPYERILQTLITASLDETEGFFGTESNDLANILVNTFNERGRLLTDYVKEQLSQTQGFVQTANDAATAMQEQENG